MKKITLITALCLSTLVSSAQRVFNRYGQPLKAADAGWTAPGAESFTSRQDTIPEFDVPYRHTPGILGEADFKDCTTREFVYKTYPSGRRVGMAVDLPADTAGGPYPIMVMIHGGAWRNGTYEGNSQVSGFLASHGIAVARVGYTLMDDGTVEESLSDLRDAVAFLAASAPGLGIDPSRIGFMGTSAGGHLASMMAMTQPETKALISICGPQNLTWMLALEGLVPQEAADGIKRYFRMGDDPLAALKRYSPQYNIPSDRPIPPVMLIHGTYDMTVPYGQSTGFASALLKAGATEVELVTQPYATHNCLGPHIASWEADLERILDFLKGNL